MSGAVLASFAALLVLVPTPSKPEPSQAIAEGRLRLSASVSGHRLRVALVDTDELVGRVQAFAVDGGIFRPLPRLDTSAADRIEFALDPSVGPSPTIRVEAYAREAVPPLLLHAIEMIAALEAPRAPTPPAPAPIAATAPEAPGVPWWLIAGAMIAASLAGAAVFQELDAP